MLLSHNYPALIIAPKLVQLSTIMFNTIGSNTRAAVLEHSQVFRFDQILNNGGMTSLMIPSNLYRVLLLTAAAAAAWPFKQQ